MSTNAQGEVICTESHEIKTSAMKVAVNLERFLQQRKGQYQCGNLESDTYSYDELRQQLINDHL